VRQVGGFLWVLQFLQTNKKWLSRYNWNIVESGIKHHKPTEKMGKHKILTIFY
jgi:hypothetical protein